MKYLVNCMWLYRNNWHNTTKSFDDYESAKAFAEYFYDGKTDYCFDEVTVLIYELKESMN